MRKITTTKPLARKKVEPVVEKPLPVELKVAKKRTNYRVIQVYNGNVIVGLEGQKDKPYIMSHADFLAAVLTYGYRVDIGFDIPVTVKDGHIYLVRAATSAS